MGGPALLSDGGCGQLKKVQTYSLFLVSVTYAGKNSAACRLLLKHNQYYRTGGNVCRKNN